MPNIEAAKINRPTAKRIAARLLALKKLLQHSPYARTITGLDGDDINQLEDDAFFLKSL